MIDPRDGLECDVCGGVAVCPDAAGVYALGTASCAECGCPGFITTDDIEQPLWWADTEDP